MAERRPLVIKDGVVQEIPTGDTFPTSLSGSGGSTTFTALTDTPADFTGQALKALRVNTGETALEFTDFPTNTSSGETLIITNQTFSTTLSEINSNSSFATKGSIYTVLEAMYIWRLSFNLLGGIGHTYKAMIAKVSGANFTIQEIIATSPTKSVEFHDLYSFEFPTTILLDANTSYAFMLIRTDTTATAVNSIRFPSELGLDNLYFSHEGSIRYASNNPIVTDDTLYGVDTVTEVIIYYTLANFSVPKLISYSAVEIEAALDAYYGNTDWRTGSSGSSTIPDIVQKTGLENNPPVGAHTGWRIRSISNPDASYVGIQEVEFNEVVGAKTSGTAIASSEYSASYGAQKAFDNVDNINSYWSTVNGGTTNAYVGYIEPTAYAVTSFALTAPASAFVAYMPTEFALEFSDDGTNWTTVQTYTTTWTGGQRRVFSAPTTLSNLSYFMASGDFDGRTIWLPDSATPIDVTVPAGMTALNPVTIIQKGAGKVSFVAGSGVTILSAGSNLSIAAQYGSASLVPDASTADTYYLIGHLNT